MINIKITGKFDYQTFPKTEDMVLVDENVLQDIGITKCFDVENNCVIDYDNSQELLKKELDDLRQQRETECFSIINRGKLWYDNLTEEQLSELRIWYNAWLDVTETRVIPEMPSWIKK